MFSVHVFSNHERHEKNVLYYKRHTAIITQRKLDLEDFLSEKHGKVASIDSRSSTSESII